MRYFFRSFLLLGFIFVLQSSCQKRLFLKVHVKGTLIDASNGSPVRTQISLMSEDYTKIKHDQKVLLWEGVTDPGGNFDITAPAGMRPYYLIYLKINGKSLNLDISNGVLSDKSMAFFYSGDHMRTDLKTVKVIR